MDNSKLFFIIYRNIVLKNKIWDFVREITEFNKQSAVGDSKLSFVRKYKDIHQVRWMVNNNHLGLLKSKVDKNEYLSFDSDTFNYSIILKVQDEETFGSLYNRYRDEFKNIPRESSLIAIAIRYGNLSALKILLNDNELTQHIFTQKQESQQKDTDNTTFIKLIDLSIKSGRPETLEYIIQFLKNKQEEVIEGDKGSLLELHYSQDEVLKNCFSSPSTLIKNMFQYIFLNYKNLLPSIDLKRLVGKNTPIKFTESYNYLNYGQLVFTLENNLVKYNKNEFISLINSYSIFFDGTQPIETLDYLNKFIYIFKNHYIQEEKESLNKQQLDIMFSILEKLNQSIDQITQLTNSLDNIEQVNRLLNEPFIYFSDKPISLPLIKEPTKSPYENPNWLSSKLLANNHHRSFNFNKEIYNSNTNTSSSSSSNINNNNNDDNEDDDDDGASGKTNRETKIIIDEDENDKVKLSIEKRVMKRIISIYMYNFFYPLVSLYQLTKVEITINKYLILRNDLLILPESNSLIEQYCELNKELVSIKYISFKEIMINSFENADLRPLEFFKRMFNRNEKTKELLEYSSLLISPLEFKIFRNVPWNDWERQRNYLEKLIQLKNSYFAKFQYSNLFCWLAQNNRSKYDNYRHTKEEETILHRQMDYVRDRIDSSIILKESLTNYKISVPSKAVESNNYILTEYTLINKGYFSIDPQLYLSAIIIGSYRIIKLLIQHEVEISHTILPRVIATNDLKMVKLFLENSNIEICTTSLVTAIEKNYIDIFKYLLSSIEIPNKDNDIGEEKKDEKVKLKRPQIESYNTEPHSVLYTSLSLNNKMFLNAIKENRILYESGMFGDLQHLSSIISLNLGNTEPNKMNTIQMFRQGKNEEILSFLKEQTDRSVLLKHLKLLEEAIDFNQMDFLFNLLNLFNKFNLFYLLTKEELENIEYYNGVLSSDGSKLHKPSIIPKSTPTTKFFNNFVIHCAKSNHLQVLDYLWHGLELKLNPQFNTIFNQLSINQFYVSKEVIDLLYRWCIYSDFPNQLIATNLFSLFIECLQYQRFSLFKYINDTFYSYTYVSIPYLIKSKILSITNNLNFKDYLLTKTIDTKIKPLIINSDIDINNLHFTQNIDGSVILFKPKVVIPITATTVNTSTLTPMLKRKKKKSNCNIM